jgi:hypothetical protein
MKINFETPILGIDGEPIILKDKEGEPKFTIRDVAVNALLMESQESAKLDGKEKVKRFRLADRIFGCKEPIKMEAEEVALVKDQISKAYGTLVTARAWDILEGAATLKSMAALQEDAPAES